MEYYSTIHPSIQRNQKITRKPSLALDIQIQDKFRDLDDTIIKVQ